MFPWPGPCAAPRTCTAPHRTAQLSGIAIATAPFSEPDAAKRVFDASKPLKAAGIPVLTALRNVAHQMREIAAEPIVKGAMSTALTAALPAPYLRFCRPCDATHPYEMPFRLAALHAGLRLQPGTSPPVLERIPGWTFSPYELLAEHALAPLNVIRNYLRFYGPATVKQVAAFIDCPAKEVKAHWPRDTVNVAVVGESEVRSALASSLDLLISRPNPEGAIRLMGPYDPYLQLKDRASLVQDEPLRKSLWPVLGRPGAIACDAEVLGTWRPRTKGKSLTLRLVLWEPEQAGPALWSELETQGQDLADFRGLEFAGWADK
ncbi:DNA glycosylase AlkZ-like family protein [Tomitella biformata]|uniref:DNA glycosylase AlkZ-like family protein n=1 Tax=Tomitella biformata TaxID=630403 RepID=UPI001F3E18B5|nr:crosslink repair DNA glycosylase YcaQ family protein [Tomitella biformata]